MQFAGQCWTLIVSGANGSGCSTAWQMHVKRIRPVTPYIHFPMVGLNRNEKPDQPAARCTRVHYAIQIEFQRHEGAVFYIIRNRYVFAIGHCTRKPRLVKKPSAHHQRYRMTCWRSIRIDLRMKISNELRRYQPGPCTVVPHPLEGKSVTHSRLRRCSFAVSYATATPVLLKSDLPYDSSISPDADMAVQIQLFSMMK